jgi:hypothetical protein
VQGLGTTLQLAWKHDDKAPLRDGLKNLALFRDPFFMDNKPNVGPDQWRTKLTPLPLAPTRQLSDGNLGDDYTVDGVNGFVPKHGWTHVTIDPDVNDYDRQNAAAYKIAHVFGPGEDLSDIVDTDQTVPGAYLHIQENLFYQNQKLTRGESCVTPPQADPLYGYLPEPFQSQIRTVTGCQAP